MKDIENPWRATLAKARQEAKDSGLLSTDADIAAAVSEVLEEWGQPGVERGAVNHWFTGRNQPNLSQFMALCRALKINTPAAMREIFVNTQEQQILQKNSAVVKSLLGIPQETNEYLQIHRLSAIGSMGNGDEQIDDDVVCSISLRVSWLRDNVPGVNVGSLRIISGRGNSMSPTFNDGDLLLVDCSIKTVKIDGVYVLSAQGRLFIKTVRQRLDGCYEISSDNPTVKTVDVLDGSHEVVVHGRVIRALNWKKL